MGWEDQGGGEEGYGGGSGGRERRGVGGSGISIDTQ